MTFSVFYRYVCLFISHINPQIAKLRLDKTEFLKKRQKLTTLTQIENLIRYTKMANDKLNRTKLNITHNVLGTQTGWKLLKRKRNNANRKSITVANSNSNTNSHGKIVNAIGVHSGNSITENRWELYRDEMMTSAILKFSNEIWIIWLWVYAPV